MFTTYGKINYSSKQLLANEPGEERVPHQDMTQQRSITEDSPSL